MTCTTAPGEEDLTRPLTPASSGAQGPLTLCRGLLSKCSWDAVCTHGTRASQDSHWPMPMEHQASGQQRSGGRGGYSRFWGSGDSFGPVKQEETCNWGVGSAKRRLDGAQITTLNQSRSHLQSPSLLEGLPGLFNLRNPAPQAPFPEAVSYLHWPCSAS